jgi:p-aminobenzoyl-glutamate transporter AbgT
METFITAWPLWTYLIGIPIVYAIMENPKDKGPFETAPMVAALWPIMLLYFIYAILVYPFYWITKKVKNKLKH